MVRQLAETGFIQGRLRKPVIRPRGAILRTPPIWAYIQDGVGRGQRIGEYFITGLRAMWTASRGIRRGSKSGGTREHRNGWGTMFRTSRPTLIPRITWGRSS